MDSSSAKEGNPTRSLRTKFDCLGKGHRQEQQQQSVLQTNFLAHRIYLFIFVLIIIINDIIELRVDALQLTQLVQSQTTSTDSSSAQLYETRCLACIKSVTSAGLDPTKRCEGYYCGPYQFSYQYWAEAGKPGKSDGVRDFEKCARDTNCAESTVKAYYQKFKRDCNNDGLIDCLDFAALHKAGPTTCSQEWFYKSRYWQAFNKTSCAFDRDLTSAIKVAPNELKNSLISKNGSSSNQKVVLKNQTLTSECLDCICEALTSCTGASSSAVAAINCGSGTVCGPFAISQSYWKEGRRPGSSWTACTRTKECSTVTIKNYMDKHKRDCNGDGYVNCEDYAAIHRRGPASCMNRDLLKEHYWTKFLACRANQKPKNDASLVRVNEDSNDSLISSTLVSRYDTSSTQKRVGIGEDESNSSNHPTAVLITTPSTTTTTTTPTASSVITSLPASLQTAPAASQDAQTSSSTILVRPMLLNGISSEYSSAHSTKESAEKRHHQSGLTPADTYELSPIAIETQPHMSTLTGSYPQISVTTQHIYDYPDSSASSSNYSNDNFSSNDNANLAQNSSPPMTNSKSSNSFLPTAHPNDDDYKVSLSTTYNSEYHHHHQQQPPTPINDYSSLPTIIVGKPLGSISTSRISQAPPVLPADSSVAQSYPHGSSPIDYQYRPTMVMQHQPTTTSMELATTVSVPNSASSRSSQTVTIEQQAISTTTGPSIASITTTTSPTITADSSLGLNQPSTGMILNQEAQPIDTDYLIQGLGVASFDRVVNGIVANPDFSKSYPPMPLIQHKQSSGSMPTLSSPPRGPALQAHKKEQQASAVASSFLTREPTGSQSSGKRDNAKNFSNFGSSDNIHPLDQQHQQGNSSEQQHQSSNGDPAASRQPSANPFGDGSIVGPDALNMSSLFGAGGLNESSRIPGECLDCICDASSNCDATVQCISKQREKNRCGLYMISWNQYKESDISLTAMMLSSTGSHSTTTTVAAKNDDYDEKLYYECSTDKSCAEKLIHLYIEKYSKDCNNDGIIDCYDIAAIHRVGPDQCNSNKFLSSQYWRDFNHCYATDRLTTTIQPQVSQQTG